MYLSLRVPFKITQLKFHINPIFIFKSKCVQERWRKNGVKAYKYMYTIQYLLHTVFRTLRRILCIISHTRALR